MMEYNDTGMAADIAYWSRAVPYVPPRAAGAWRPKGSNYDSRDKTGYAAMWVLMERGKVTCMTDAIRTCDEAGLFYKPYKNVPFESLRKRVVPGFKRWEARLRELGLL
jgi:hypothetical protein